LGIASGPESTRLWDKSLKLLLQSQQDGLGDPDVHATLAQLLFQKEPLRAVSHARIALEQPTLNIESRLNALFALASHHHSRKQPKQALVYLDQLTQLRRSASDWELRALCLLQQRDLTAAINALETAIGIDPNLLQARNMLAQLYMDKRQFELANTQKRILRRLAQFLRQN
jgi:tetratricopeptide (TPR) repeat protein